MSEDEHERRHRWIQSIRNFANAAGIPASREWNPESLFIPYSPEIAWQAPHDGGWFGPQYLATPPRHDAGAVGAGLIAEVGNPATAERLADVVTGALEGDAR